MSRLQVLQWKLTESSPTTSTFKILDLTHVHAFIQQMFSENDYVPTLELQHETAMRCPTPGVTLEFKWEYRD